MRPQVGDRHEITCTDTGGQVGRHVVTVTQVDQLWCGCWRLYTDRPRAAVEVLPDAEGYGGYSSEIQVLTGCRVHPDQRQPVGGAL